MLGSLAEAADGNEKTMRKLLSPARIGNSSYPSKLQQCFDHGRAFARCVAVAVRRVNTSTKVRNSVRSADSPEKGIFFMLAHCVRTILCAVPPMAVHHARKHSIGAVNAQFRVAYRKARGGLKTIAGSAPKNTDNPTGRTWCCSLKAAFGRGISPKISCQREIVGRTRRPNGSHLSRAGPVCSRRAYKLISPMRRPNKRREEPNCRMIAPDVHAKIRGYRRSGERWRDRW